VIPQSFITDLLNRVDIVEVVGRYVQLRKGGANLLGLCPFHNEKSPSFTVSPSKQFYHCFGCGVHGTAIGFLMEFSGMSYPEAIRDLAQSAGMTVPDEDPATVRDQVTRKAESVALSEVLGKASAYYKQQLRGSPRAIDYLKGRGLTGEIAAHFGLGYAPDRWDGLKAAFLDYELPELVGAGLVIQRDAEGPDAAKRYDRFRDRIMFPIRSVRGEVIGFGGRIIDQGEPKYLNSPETAVFQKGNELYGLFEARQAIRERDFALVVEGYMDVVALAQLGFGNVVATLGTACTPVHVQKLLRQTDHVVFSFDGDGAGRKAAWRALEASLPYAADDKLLSFLFLPPEHDPDTFVREEGPEAFEREVSAAWPLSVFFVRHLSENVDLDTAEGRARLQHDALPLIKLLPDGALRGQVLTRLAEVALTSPEALASQAGIRLRSARSLDAGRRASATGGGRAPVTVNEQKIVRFLLGAPGLYFQLDGAARAALAEGETPLSWLAQALSSSGFDAQHDLNYAELTPMLEVSPYMAEYRARMVEVAGGPRPTGAPELGTAEEVWPELFEAVLKLRLHRIREERDFLTRSEVPITEQVARLRELDVMQRALQLESQQLQDQGPDKT
jgi:DNA primase